MSGVMGEGGPVDEVRPALGRPNDVLDPSIIAGRVRIEDNPVVTRLGERWVDVGFEGLEIPKVPEGIDGEWTFLKRDLAPRVKAQWDWLRPMYEKGIKGYEWVRKYSPKTVVVWNDSYPDTRGMCLAAKDIGSTSVELVHGLTHVYRIGHWETRSYVDWKLGTPEYKMWADFYGLGAKVIPTGTTLAHPYIGLNDGEVRTTARAELKIPDGAPVVCYLSDAAFGRSAWADQGYSVGAFVEFAKAWAMVQRVVDGAHLIVKLHPMEHSRRGVEKYEKALLDVGITSDYAIVDENLPLALFAADLTCGLQSTAMAIGLTLGIPCVILGYEPFFPVWLYEGRGFKVVREPKGVVRAVTELLLGYGMDELIDETREGAKFFTGATDGFAPSRMARAIEAIAEGREPGDECWA